ncbi:hypothetical protein OKW21_004960 [Catalinimonas alkaloidigena]|uniref:hypothetical protein n=1 Tax=Catalinimonas alkaloidigena TaxID=1075417 RepID=UPI0024056C83|nr:hypothetical protein [Catalinimonas alkaloidigena]MDF9799697.1 hypothetical protein [Catalinimonas alkaloidigena]
MTYMYFFKKDKYVFLLALFLFLSISIVLHYDQAPEDFGFAYEYGNIAASLANGNGYANVFTAQSGPTAWMLPVNTCIFALIFFLFGTKTTMAMWAVIVLNCMLWAGTIYLCFKVLNRFSGIQKYAYLFVFLSLILILLDYRSFLDNIMDVALINFMTIATLNELLKFRAGDKNLVSLILIAIALPLISPGLFLAFAILLAAFFIIDLSKVLHTHKLRLSTINFSVVRQAVIVIVLLVVSFFSTLTWGSRNYASLGKFIPSKSNFWYEFYQANMLDDDGVLDLRTFVVYHPFYGGKHLQTYKDLGEVKFGEFFALKVKENFKAREYLSRLANRLKVAFFYSLRTSFSHKADTEAFHAEDLIKLISVGYIHEGNWIALDLERSAFINNIQELNLTNQSAVISDWNSKKIIYRRVKGDYKSLMKAILFSLIPFVCILLGAFIKKIRSSKVFQWGVLIYFLQLSPYILISHYQRYQSYVFILQIIFMVFVLSYLLSLVEDRSFKLMRRANYKH